jgi:hypothetical protein
MIVKQVPMKSVKKSDFAELVKYITNAQQKAERVGGVTVTNCQSDRPDAAVLEVINTQVQNTRAESDKTYHLIVSFRGDEPDEITLNAIEARICGALGYGDHQRVSAVHHDTDNLHIHIAINKIHPTRYSIHTPYNDHKILGELCERLELDYGLERDNHQAQKRGAENRAADMERHAGVESLLGWIQRGCLKEIQAAQSWVDLHAVMRDNGLELRARGNGLIIADQSGTVVKASSVARELSKGKLEARLGAFEASAEWTAKQAAKPARQYEPRPIRTRVDTVELYARYKAEQQDIGASRSLAWAQARDRKNRLIEAAKRTGRLKRAAIKLLGDPGVSRKLLYALASKTLRDEIEKINKQYLRDRQVIHEKCQRQTWADWLRRKATEGDREALAALRARDAAQGLKGNTLAATGAQQVGQDHKAEAHQDSITKTGTIIYRVGSSAVRDDGEKLKVSRGVTQDGLQTALCMAMERYGNRITVNGTAEFREQVAGAAAIGNLPLTFEDAVLDRRRQALLNEAGTKGLGHPEQREELSDHGLRPDFSRTGEASPAMPATGKDIEKRDQGRYLHFDIKNHIRYTDRKSGVETSAGTHQGEEIPGVPIDEASAQRQKRVAVGDAVTVTQPGSTKTKGRSR